MPSATPQPEKEGLDDVERLDAYAREIVAKALLECSEPGWVVLDVAKTPVGQYHDLQDTAAAVLRRLRRAGLALTPTEEADSLL